MNELEKSLVNHKYSNPRIQKSTYLYKRTKNERIKNKIFTRLITEYIKDVPVTEIDGMVLMTMDEYKKLQMENN